MARSPRYMTQQCATQSQIHSYIPGTIGKTPSQWPAPLGILTTLVRQMNLEFVNILSNGFNQGFRLRRTLSAKLEMLYTNENAIPWI
ncbi:uncharacterized protein BO88DRAFT_407244 [Aspergillus vadensis CBS 113365]|uniref:Uncharacterized protein n=1 Tax=Aspergillus vadensis (strain CBS 113365 / IMI 142717 / IBT 24658) TaxID=1448311 RepID=A0A319BJT3_ASPVC|nr:hypothetical protein BO88DRAFT_407244 [Aspergillus vadensis CBS 113365]PYH65953.1 hypothetical protein BO88DRAFT_407244 [Aspergillus vadensis CBS 113365]